LGQAVADAISGDTIKVAPGTYVVRAGPAENNDPGMTYIRNGIDLHTLTIEWEVPGLQPIIDQSAFAQLQGNSGGRPIGILAGSRNRNLTVRGLVLIGHPAGDSYGINTDAGYVEGVGFGTNPPSTLTIEYCKLVRWADGVKGTIYNREITCNIRYSTVEDCTGNSLTHGIYWPATAELNALGCTFRTTVAGIGSGAASAGHLLKSRARVTTVRGCLFDMAGGGAACIETPSGGRLTVQGNVIMAYNVGDPSNPPIKYGFEESALRITISSPSGGPLAVGTVFTGASSGNSGTVTNVLSTNVYVYSLNNGGSYLNDGETIRVAGVARGTITRAGSPDGTSNDGRTHSVNVDQNTIVKEQPSNWPATTTTAIGALWISTGMTNDLGNPITVPPATMRNNLVTDNAGSATGAGQRTLLDYPLNTAVPRSTIGPLGVYSAAPVAGNPSVNDAAYAWAGEFTPPRARTDTSRGGR